MIAIFSAQSSGLHWLLKFALPIAFIVIVISSKGLKSSLVIAGAMVIGLGAVQLDSDQDPHRLRSLLDRGLILSDEPVSIIGSVPRVPEIFPDGFQFDLETDSVATPRFCATSRGRLSVRVKTGAASSISSGSKIRVSCFLRREDIFRNPGGFRQLEFLDGEDRDATCNLKSTLLLEIADGQTDLNGFDLGQLRNRAISEIISEMGPVQGGIVSAVTLGNKEFLDGRVAEIFRKGGTFHLLIISGLHMTFIAGVILFIVTLFTHSRWIHFILVTPIIWIYAEMVGWESPVTRACLMFTLILLGRCFFRLSEPLNLVMMTAGISLVMQPRDIFNASFQLTFLSVIAVTSFALPVIDGLRKMGGWIPSKATPFPPPSDFLRSIAETIYWNPREWDFKNRGNNWTATLVKHPIANLYHFPLIARTVSRLFEGFLVSLIVQIVLLPVQIILFHRVTPAGMLLNLAIAPLIAFQAVTAMLMLAVEGLSPNLADIVLRFSLTAGELTLWVSKVLLESGIDDLRVPIYDGVGQIVYLIHFALLLVMLFALRSWDPLNRRRGLSFFATIIAISFAINATLIVFVPLSSPISDGKLRIHFLDVGQGDATFIIFPNGETMLVDGGGMPSFAERDSEQDFTPDTIRIGESVVSEFLWEMGYSKIDHVIATHSDADHIQGLIDVVSNFRVGRIHLGEMNPESQEYKKLISSSLNQGIKTAHAFAGDVMDVGGTRLEVLNPPRDGIVKSTNEGSLVLRIVYGKRRFLLTGDIESEGESFVVSQKDIRADLVKVAHHGSRTSSSNEFIRAVGARHAIIPVGRRSRFSHPHAEVLERWRSSGARIMSTGKSGTITVTTDGDEMSITSFTGD